MLRKNRLRGGDLLPRRGLVSYWKLDEESGQSAIDSINGYNLQLGSTSGVDANDPSWANNALSFAGYDYLTDTATLKTAFNFTTQMSAAVIFRATGAAVNAFEGLICKYDTGANARSWALAINSASGDKLQCVLSSDGTVQKNYLSVTNTYRNGNYYCFGITFYENELLLYVNGQEIEVTKSTDLTVNSLYQATSVPLAAGITYSSGSPYEDLSLNNAEIVSIILYNVKLFQPEMNNLYLAMATDATAKGISI